MRSLEALALLACAAVIAAAGPATAQPSGSASDLLDRIAEADDAHYRAKQLVVSFGNHESAAVLDVQASGGRRTLRAESGNGEARSWTSQLVHSNVAQVGMRPARVLEKYSVEASEPQELLGVELIPLALVRRTDGSVAERWWVHEPSGVVYKRELFDASGELAGMATIIEMDWGKSPAADAVVSELAAPHAPEADAPDAPQALTGGYAFWRAYDIVVEDRPAEQWVYSDGLHALSVFRTEGALAAPDGFVSSETAGRRVWTGPGPGTWAWEGDGHAYLVVAEEPSIDPADLLEPFPSGGRSIFERLGSVWSRLFRALGSLFD